MAEGTAAVSGTSGPQRLAGQTNDTGKRQQYMTGMSVMRIAMSSGRRIAKMKP
ncbi:hypothetical protein [Bifidobacterium sp. ESL0745]|uniref:hypothetical protein n=1 Tax=Bifidobacterium sp. ESL0745 TaxID=2983226 RepID=UPI0023F8E56C|nr:hypothetical protein [Bifidobacterium sp. ESL0745]MDF7665609.1 hypothetical protein [Bifidobacterium sp. ESL0745]